MRRSLLAITILALCAGPGAAQNKPDEKNTNEQVIVTAPMLTQTPDAMAHDMVRSLAAPSVLLGQIARFHHGVCARTDGLSSRALNAYVTQQIMAVAAKAGAPVAPQPCRPNVMVRFTDRPQALLDAIHEKDPVILGYRGATTVSHPIQAWYITGTTDINGNTGIDQEVFTTMDLDIVPGKDGAPPVTIGIEMDNTPFNVVGGWRGHPDLTSDILGVYIIADSSKTGDLKLGPVADYIAMLALSQTKAFESCQNITSIMNLMAAGCAAKPDAITASDIAYLHGVYTMDPGAPLQVQQNNIASVMAAAISSKPPQK